MFEVKYVFFSPVGNLWDGCHGWPSCPPSRHIWFMQHSRVYISHAATNMWCWWNTLMWERVVMMFPILMNDDDDHECTCAEYENTMNKIYSGRSVELFLPVCNKYSYSECFDSSCVLRELTTRWQPSSMHFTAPPSVSFRLYLTSTTYNQRPYNKNCMSK